MVSPTDQVLTNGLVTLGAISLRTLSRTGFGLVITGDVQGTPAYLDAVFADRNAREAFFQLVDRHGVVVARNLVIDPTPYRRVRGKRSRGRLSQGELFHHDGCSTPTRPRVVEIRCPPQPSVRSMGTSVAVFPDVVETMLRLLPSSLRRAGLEEVHDAVERGDTEGLDWELLQGELNRLLRLISPEAARRFFHQVDAATPSFTEPWTLGESRFMANENAGRTVQHRRACRTPWVQGVPNGDLIKRWPAEELEP